MEKIKVNEFKRRTIDFFVRSALYELPAKRTDRLIFLKAISLLFNKDSYTEKEINETIKKFLSIVPTVKVDHVKIRRYLVDEGFLTRKIDGSRYFISKDAFSDTFEEEINGVDLQGVIAEAQREIEERRKKFQH